MQVYSRKNSLRLRGYDYSREGIYFLTIRTKNGEMMFGEIEKGRMVLNEYGEAVQRIIGRTGRVYENLSLECYTVMPNHIHLLVRITGDEKNRQAGENVNVRAAGGIRPCGATIPKVVHALKALTTKELGFSLWHRSY